MPSTNHLWGGLQIDESIEFEWKFIEKKRVPIAVHLPLSVIHKTNVVTVFGKAIPTHKKQRKEKRNEGGEEGRGGHGERRGERKDETEEQKTRMGSESRK